MAIISLYYGHIDRKLFFWNHVLNLVGRGWAEGVAGRLGGVGWLGLLAAGAGAGAGA